MIAPAAWLSIERPLATQAPDKHFGLEFDPSHVIRLGADLGDQPLTVILRES